MTTIGLTGFAIYEPAETITGAEIAEISGIPEEVVVEKMGIVQKRICPADAEHITDMCVDAARRALVSAELDASDLDLVVYHGSEFKDYIVWSAAAHITDRLGADNAYATERHTLCASTPIAIRSSRAMLATGEIETALHVTASREEDLIDYTNLDSSFMFNFGSGAAAYVLERSPGDRALATVHQSAALTDGSFAEDVIMPAGGTLNPPSASTVAAGEHRLDVVDPDDMKERLGPVSLPNFVTVTETALERSDKTVEDLDFMALTHMKRSFHEDLLRAFDLDPETDAIYLDHHGHVQSADQFIALEQAADRGLLEPDDTLSFTAAGTGYTWGATILTWHG